MGSTKQQTIEIVAGAGGAKGPGLIGGFRALEELDVAVGKITGVSIGSLMAAFYANGYRSAELVDLFVEESLKKTVADRVSNPWAWLHPARLLGLGVINMRPYFQELVDEYGLKPRRNLRIVAYNLCTRSPIVFEGTQYDLATALTASCCIPGMMRPVLYVPKTRGHQRFVTRQAAMSMSKPGILVDGGVHHMQPTEFCSERAIVFRLGTASSLPGEWLNPIEAWFHGLEMVFGRLLPWLQPDSDENIVIDVGPRDVGGVTFSVSANKCREMVENGYRTASDVIKRAIRLGQIPTLKAV